MVRARKKRPGLWIKTVQSCSFSIFCFFFISSLLIAFLQWNLVNHLPICKIYIVVPVQYLDIKINTDLYLLQVLITSYRFRHWRLNHYFVYQATSLHISCSIRQNVQWDDLSNCLLLDMKYEIQYTYIYNIYSYNIPVVFNLCFVNSVVFSRTNVTFVNLF